MVGDHKNYQATNLFLSNLSYLLTKFAPHISSFVFWENFVLQLAKKKFRNFITYELKILIHLDKLSEIVYFPKSVDSTSKRWTLKEMNMSATLVVFDTFLRKI